MSEQTSACPFCGMQVEKLYQVFSTEDSPMACSHCVLTIPAWIKYKSEEKGGKLCPVMSFRVGGGDGDNMPNTREVCCRESHCAWWDSYDNRCSPVIMAQTYCTSTI